MRPDDGVRTALTAIHTREVRLVEKATGLWSLSVTDTVTGLRELPGYPPPTGARRDWPWKVGIQPAHIRPTPSKDYAPYAHVPRNPQVRGR